MKKITKKEGQEILMNKTSKMVLSTTGNMEALLRLFNRIDKEEYLYQVKNSPARIGVKANGKNMAFKVMEGTQKGMVSYLTDLTGSTWYKHEEYGLNFIVVSEKGDIYITVYEILN